MKVSQQLHTARELPGAFGDLDDLPGPVRADPAAPRQVLAVRVDARVGQHRPVADDLGGDVDELTVQHVEMATHLVEAPVTTRRLRLDRAGRSHA